MGGEFTETTLGQLLSFANGRSSPDRADGQPYPVYGSNGVIGRAAEANSIEGSIVIGRVGSYCGSLYLSKELCWVTDNAIRATALDRNDPLFLFYLLGTLDLNNWRTGSGQPLLNQNILSRIPTAVPEPDEQRAIAHILGTLDDEIELNRRMNGTLEAMARALFKSWFVDFDPVRAKAEGRDPGLPQHLADLFPYSFENSELGEIPKGWEVGRLDSVLVLQRGFDLPAAKRLPGEQPVLAASGPSGTHNEFMVRGPGVTTGRSGVLGKVFYVHENFWPLNTSLWVKEFRQSLPAYAFHLLQGLDFNLFNAGSAVPTLNRNHVHNLSTLLPPFDLVAAFERFTTPYLNCQKINDDQSRTLAALRDTLLPKLISGELRIKDAERFVGRIL